MAQVTSGFGYRKHPVLGDRRHHDGVDYKTPIGTPIYTNKPMRVVKSADNQNGYGSMIITEDDRGNRYTYAHLDSRNVKVGDQIPPGTMIGKTGNTGRSTGPHLHYEVTNANGKKIDPQTKDPDDPQGRSYADSAQGFEPGGKGLNTSVARASPDTKPGSKADPGTAPSDRRTETPEDAKQRKKDKDKAKESEKEAQRPVAPRPRPPIGNVGIIENPLNKL